jgi:hypothetical protein
VILQLEYDSFPPSQAELVTDEFRLEAKRWATTVLQTKLSEPIEFAEGVVGTLLGVKQALLEGEAAWRENHFTLTLHAFTLEQVVFLHMLRISYDRGSGTFAVVEDEVWGTACILERFNLPNDDWLEWFVRGPRCPACEIMPDMTTEYLSCDLCGYADYQDDSPDSVRVRFFGEPKNKALAASIRAMLSGAVEEPDRARRLYLRYRLDNLRSYLAPSQPTGLKPLPWEES